MTGPQFLIIAPLILAAIAFIIRRWRRMVAAFGAASILLVGISLAATAIDGLPTSASGDVWVLWGRTLTLTESSRDTLLIFISGMGLLFLLTLLTPQSSIFIPIGLVLVSPVAALLMIRPFVFGAVMILTVAAGTALLIQDEKSGSTLASWRYLSIMALAPPLLLIIGWMVETDRSQFLPAISWLTAMASIVLLIGFPFHIWIGPGAGQSHPLVAVIALGLVQMILVIFCANLISSNLALFQNPSFTLLLRASGMLTLGLAAMFTLISPSLGHLVGYLVMFDAGLAIYALGSGNLAGLNLALSSVLVRVVSLFLVAIGLGGVRKMALSTDPENQASVNQFARYRGIAQRLPFAVILLFYGLLSLIGIPGTPGFISRWTLIVHTGRLSSPTLIIIMASVGISVGSVLRWSLRFTGSPQSFQSEKMPVYYPTSIVAALSLGAALLLAFFPQWLEGIVAGISVP